MRGQNVQVLPKPELQNCQNLIHWKGLFRFWSQYSPYNTIKDSHFAQDFHKFKHGLSLNSGLFSKILRSFSRRIICYSKVLTLFLDFTNSTWTNLPISCHERELLFRPQSDNCIFRFNLSQPQRIFSNLLNSMAWQ